MSPFCFGNFFLSCRITVCISVSALLMNLCKDGVEWARGWGRGISVSCSPTADGSTFSGGDRV